MNIAELKAKLEAFLRLLGGFYLESAAKKAMLRTLLPVQNCRSVGKKDLKLNNLTPNVEIDPDSYQVRVDGELIESQPAKELPLAQRYFLF